MLVAQCRQKSIVRESFPFGAGAVRWFHRSACPSLESSCLSFPHNTRLFQGKIFDAGKKKAVEVLFFSWSPTITHPPVGAIDRCMLRFSWEYILVAAGRLPRRPFPLGSDCSWAEDCRHGRIFRVGGRVTLLLNENNLFVFSDEVRRQLKVPPR